LLTGEAEGLVSRSARVAAVLWIVFAFLVWNVVFDRILVLAGRRYSYAAGQAARHATAYLRIDDWMRPAVAHGVRVASLVGFSVAVIGLVAVLIASRLDQRRQGRS
jgi:hypothetical protein